jgi:histidinol-phosphatase (PHP family)
VIKKRNGALRFFDEREDWYQHEIQLTAGAAAQRGVIVEINTGGIARGAIDDIYPSRDFLRVLNSLGVPVMLNSDAHSARDIDHSFDRARQCAKEAGYTEAVYLLDGKRHTYAL